MSHILKINEKSITKIKEKFQFTGIGNSKDPILINKLSPSIGIIKIKNVTSHISINEIKAYEIKIIKSRNISINNSKLFRLDIEACYNLTIKNNSIFYGALRYCRESQFVNNTFHQDYAAVKFSESGSNSGDLMMKKFQIGVPIASFFPIFIIQIAFFFKSIIMGFFSLFLYILPLIAIVDISIKKKFINNLGSNTFKNNASDNLEDLKSLFLKP